MNDQGESTPSADVEPDPASIPRYADLSGKTVLVTGSSRGIGRATAMAFAANGAKVLVNGRDRRRLQEAVDRIAAWGGDAAPVPADFSDSAAIGRTEGEIRSRFGPVDILVANVGGLGDPVPTAEETEDHWRSVIDANLTATFLTVRAFLPAMLARGSGTIVTVSSTAGRHPSRSSAAYAAAKAGVVMLTRHLAQEVGPRGVRVNCVAPGAVLTEEGYLARAPREVQEQVAALHPLGRIGWPMDIAQAILYLASESAGWITGVTLDASGGRVAL